MAWGDEGEEPTSPEETFEQPVAPPPLPTERPRLHLMPRGATAASAAAGAAAPGGGGGSKSNPFGAAKPREEGTNHAQ